ncbi:hypothetical protein RDABS01_004837 [Bienertia sinuspersici]
MSLILQNPLSNATYRMKLYFPNNNTHFNSSKTLKFSLLYHQTLQNNAYPLQKNYNLLRNRLSLVKAHDSSFTAFQEQEPSSTKLFNLDAFLNFLESICVVSSVLISAGFFVNWVFFKRLNNGVLLLGNRVLVWLLAGAVAVGSVIRRRQWGRVCGSPTNSKPGSETGNVIERIERLEESMRSATSIIRMLSRQLEKLGIRFRVTRKALKDPISEDQQQKQLELILAIAKSGNLFETKQTPSKVPGKQTDSDNGLRKVDGQQIEAIAAQKGIEQ